MNAFVKFFWNPGEKRLRAAFRIVIQLTLYFILMKGVPLLFGIPKVIEAVTSLWFILAISVARLIRVLGSVWPAGKFLDHRRFSDFGLKTDKLWWKDLAFGIGLGIFLMSIIFIIELVIGWVSIEQVAYASGGSRSFPLSMLAFVILFSSAGFTEELLYRGYVMTNLAEGLQMGRIKPRHAKILAMILSSVLFGIFHLGSPNATVISTLIIMAIGFLFSVSYVLTGRLAIAVGFHITWNLFQGNIFGFPISGVAYPSEIVTLFSIKQSGPDVWTGGIFGPEAGLLALFVIGIGILLILGWIRIRYGHFSIKNFLKTGKSQD